MGKLINALSIFLVIKLIIGFIEIFDYISKGKCSVWNYYVNVEDGVVLCNSLIVSLKG